MCSETSEAVGTTWEHAQLEFQKFLKIRIPLLRMSSLTPSICQAVAVFLVLSIPRLLLLFLVLLKFQSCRVKRIIGIVQDLLSYKQGFSITDEAFSNNLIIIAGRRPATPPKHGCEHHILHRQTLYTP